MPDLVQLPLPSGKIIRVCAECALEPPRHQYFCAAVAKYSRSAVLREMVRVDDEVQRVQQLVVEPAPSHWFDRELFLLRNEFWHWCWWIGLDFWGSTKEARDDIRAEVDEMRRRIERKRLEDAAA